MDVVVFLGCLLIKLMLSLKSLGLRFVVFLKEVSFAAEIQ